MTTLVGVKLLDGLDYTGILGDTGLLDLLVPGYGVMVPKLVLFSGVVSSWYFALVCVND